MNRSVENSPVFIPLGGPPAHGRSVTVAVGLLVARLCKGDHCPRPLGRNPPAFIPLGGAQIWGYARGTPMAARLRSRLCLAHRKGPREQATEPGTPVTGQISATNMTLAAQCPTLWDASLLFSPGAEAKGVRGPSVRGARRSARGGLLEQYVDHGEQAQRSNDGPIVCFDRQLVRKAGPSL